MVRRLVYWSTASIHQEVSRSPSTPSCTSSYQCLTRSVIEICCLESKTSVSSESSFVQIWFMVAGMVVGCRKQVKCLGKYFSFSFLFSAFKWFFSGIGDSCGFDNFPSLGLKAYHNMYAPLFFPLLFVCTPLINVSESYITERTRAKKFSSLWTRLSDELNLISYVFALDTCMVIVLKLVYSKISVILN